MAEVMKIGGKDPNNQVKGIIVDENGGLIIPTLEDLQTKVDSFVQDGDNAIAPSSLEEYYLDSGALFIFGSTEFFDVSAFANEAPGEMQFEMEGITTIIRIFSLFLSTLANKYRIEIFETPTRDVETEEEAENITEFNAFQPNRLEQEESFPGQLFKLEGDAEHDLSGDNYEKVFSESYLLEDTGGPTDAGLAINRTTTLRMDSENYNYIFRVLNYDTETREFAIALTLGISNFLMHNK